MAQQMYRQCRLEKRRADGALLIRTSWLPEPYCAMGAILKLKNEDGTWDDGWSVVSVSEPKNGKFVEMRSRDYLKTRKASDI